ncbi:MAG: DUF4179 domain-containing protein [Clostridium celatum]|nr:DUF4179 domain-containing protein [Clostridium celatum]
MNNSKYNEINIPDNLDERIDEGVKNANLEKIKNNRRKRNRAIGTIAASLVAVTTLGIANPALASKLPIVGGVFESIEKNINFPGNYSQYATSVNETAYSNGVGITLSEILCDGQSLYVTYIVESEKPFKYTSWGDSGLMDMNQLITSEAYNKVDFTDEELDNSGFAGLEGNFINENTFVGVQKYHLSSLKSEIPDQFTFQTKIELIENYGVNASDISSYKWGTWAFKVPVTVDKNLRKTIDLNKQDIESDTVKVNSITITPFDMIVDLNYKEGCWTDYRTVIYDENGEILQFSQSTADEDNNTEKICSQSPNSESSSIRVVVEKPILEEKEKWEDSRGSGATYEEVGKEVVFDKVIQIK